MRRARLVYNPVAGKKALAAKLDNLVSIFQSRGWQLVPYRTTGAEGKNMFAKMFQEERDDAIIVAGGDGTVHQVINGLLQAEAHTPLGIIPVGTSNDFAVHLNLPSDIEKCCELILEQKTTKVDVGLVNGTYFINVASAGLLTDVPHQTDVALKNVLGKLAYYLKGIEKLPNFQPIPIEIVDRQRIIKEDVLLFMIVNGRTAGGFTRLAPWASIVDGVFDVIVVKPCNLGYLLTLFLKLIKGEHINDPRVEYFQTSQVIINCSLDVGTDLDGEAGPAFPLDVRIIPGKLEVFTPKKNSPPSRRIISNRE